MRRLIPLLCMTCALISCGSFLTVAYQNAAALSQDQVLYRDVHTLVVTKSSVPPAPYNATLYAQIDADLINCNAIYVTIPKSTLSINQLKYLADEIRIYKSHDSVGASSASSAFVAINAEQLDSTAAEIVNLEKAKLQP